MCLEQSWREKAKASNSQAESPLGKSQQAYLSKRETAKSRSTFRLRTSLLGLARILLRSHSMRYLPRTLQPLASLTSTGYCSNLVPLQSKD